MEKQTRLIDAMLDISFRKFITGRIVGWLYVIGLVILGLHWGLTWLLGLMAVFSEQGGGWGILYIVMVTPVTILLFVAGALVLRVLAEAIVVLYSIGDRLSAIETNTGDLVELFERSRPVSEE